MNCGQRGAEVVEVVAYRTVLGGAERDGEHDVYRMLLDRQIDAVTFTSASAVRNFVEMIGQEQAADLLRRRSVASIGPVTAEAAQQLGIETTGDAEALYDPGSRRRARRTFIQSRAEPDMTLTTLRNPATARTQRPAHGTRIPPPPAAPPPPHRGDPRARARDPAVAGQLHVSAVRLSGEGQRREVGVDARRVPACRWTKR